PFTRDLAVTFAFANAPVGSDGMIRRATPVLADPRGGWLPSLALAAVAGSVGHTSDALYRALASGADETLLLPARAADSGTLRNEPVTARALAKAPWRVEYVGPAGSITTFPSAAIHAAAKSGVQPDKDNPFSGKIVFVGATFA